MIKRLIAVITDNDSDLLQVLKQNRNLELHILGTRDVPKDVLDACHAIAILGGAAKSPILFMPRDRAAIEAQIHKGKRVFSEFCLSIGHVYSQDPSTTRFERLCFCHDSIHIEGITPGDLLDDQSNTRIKPWDITCTDTRPLFQYVRVNEHSSTDVNKIAFEKIDERAIWFEPQQNLMICAFQLSNFLKARFSPLQGWISVVRYILEWLCETDIDMCYAKPGYQLHPCDGGSGFEEKLDACIKKGLAWFDGAGLLVRQGKEGLLEGVATEIYPDGSQRMLESPRPDCIGEVSLAFFLQYLKSGDKASIEIADNLISFFFPDMQVSDGGPFEGMLRWSLTAWEVCYQDDVARALIPVLLRCLFTGEKQHLDACVRALWFLVNTTGTDGTRVFRTDLKDLTEDKRKELISEPGNFPCAHYNAYYHASLLLAHRLTGIDEFRQVGIKGLETIMSVYPNTVREHSETQELCRLVLPLAYLYWTTGNKRHKDWLYQVVDDLQRFRHTSGGYAEWDTGYQSVRYGKNGEECSLLTKNGDPVADLLYSVNWLPSGFIQAYMITGDPYFKACWKDIARFMISAQVHSTNNTINGGWARAMDMERMEVFALPNDVGWGPWAMESGWTAGEILSGLLLGQQSDSLIKYYRFEQR